MTAPERISAWTWQLEYPSKKNGTREWNAVLHPSDQDVTQYIRADLVEALVAEAVDGKDEALHRIVEWADAYPPSIFPEPDFAKAAKVLSDAGLSLDAIAASSMRHVVNGVREIAAAAIRAGKGE